MMLPFCHSEPPQAAKNLAFSGNQETLHLRLRVTKLGNIELGETIGMSNYL